MRKYSIYKFLNFQHDMKDHVTFMGSHKNVGLTIIDFKRSIMPHDSADAPIPMEGPCQVCDSGLDINISSVVEFQRWWVLKSKIFAMW